ncbi:MAG: DUF1343 domain-containing protein [Deltaproteobacteria bacterium]|nr:MAG: DUF1343 domain-containing protein [Deltaproteobacteria bacterium]
MKSGLEVLLDSGVRSLSGQRVGFCCNHTAVDHRFQHGIDLLQEAGVNLVRLFGPEHGVRATAQDMIHVHEQKDPVTGIDTVSLYGATEASLHPTPESLQDLDVILFDIQDIGARYYTYQATLGYMMQVAGTVGARIVVLDRPNPINGVSVEGNLVGEGYESFVGAFPLAVRHGMTMGELSRYFQHHCGVSCNVDVIPCEGWQRTKWLDQTDMPWVYPSPNMPTLDTATVYPGTCLIEGTNLSEGRGTTRPFHLIGAPWLDPQAFAKRCTELGDKAGLRGAIFRPSAFLPGFQKHAGTNCGGIEIHVTDRNRLDAYLLGMVVTQAAYQCDPENFGWRTETYEYVDDPIAIDLLTGSDEFRKWVEEGGDLRDLVTLWEPQRQEFLRRREGCLLYS